MGFVKAGDFSDAINIIRPKFVDFFQMNKNFVEHPQFFITFLCLFMRMEGFFFFKRFFVILCGFEEFSFAKPAQSVIFKVRRAWI